jgi:phage I-like protein
MVKHALSLLGIALNAEASAPDWVQLVPAGPRIMGRDGRWWMMSDPQAVADRFDPTKEPQIDIEHSSEIKAPMGEPAPAVGWIKGIEVRDGTLWGRVEWTPTGAEIVATRAYRYLSPVFTYDFTTGEIGRIVSAGLTNQPNLEMAALNRAEEETPMDRAVLEALGLPAAATAQDALVAINAIKTERDTARNAVQTPDPTKFVPAADHQLALNRITAFERAETARRDAEIGVAVDAAIAAGKIAPSSKEFHVAACRAEGGFDRFKAFIGTAPVIAPASGLDGQKPEGAAANAEALTADELAVCRMFGTEPTAFAAAKKKEQ